MEPIILNACDVTTLVMVATEWLNEVDTHEIDYVRRSVQMGDLEPEYLDLLLAKRDEVAAVLAKIGEV